MFDTLMQDDLFSAIYSFVHFFLLCFKFALFAVRDLDESLQKALHKYLEARGIKHSLHDWLYEYMMRKDEKEYVVWLKNMKEFIGN